MAHDPGEKTSKFKSEAMIWSLIRAVRDFRSKAGDLESSLFVLLYLAKAKKKNRKDSE